MIGKKISNIKHKLTHGVVGSYLECSRNNLLNIQTNFDKLSEDELRLISDFSDLLDDLQYRILG